MDSKHLLSTLVAAQFPEFVREDYPAFVTFVELYYKFLEVEKGPQNVLSNLLSYRDIDNTLDEFISRFEKTYIDTLPPVIAADRRMLVKHVMDLYQTKGNQESYKLLFRLLFDEEIELYYPKNQILRVSDGRWTQKKSLKVKVTQGDPLAAVNKTVKINTTNGVINTFIKDVNVQMNGVVELFIDNLHGKLVNGGATVVGVGFAATVQATTTSVKVLSGGAGFTVGQVFNIDSVAGTGTRIKVTQVTNTGAIRRASIIGFGDGYKTDFQVTVRPNNFGSGNIDPYRDFTNGFKEQVRITKVSYFLNDYVEQTYSGQLIGDAYSNEYYPPNVVADPVAGAILKFSLGGVCSYHGEYSTSDGFLSDVNVMQDGAYYQDFSYVIKTKRSIEEYAGIVKKLLHPAGTAMYAQVQKEIDIDLGTQFDYAKVLSAQLSVQDYVTAVDAIRNFVQGRVLTDQATPIDVIAFLTAKALADTSTQVENIQFDFGEYANPDATTVAEALALNVGKFLSDIATTVDQISLDNGEGITDSATPVETVKLNIGKGLSDTNAVADSGTVLKNDYVEITYSTADYAGTTLATF